DEFAAYPPDDSFSVIGSTLSVTDSRIFNSTLGETAGAFDTLLDDDSIPKLTLPWWRQPEKARGLWRDERGKLRSPWYDKERKRCLTPQIAARELDIDRS